MRSRPQAVLGVGLQVAGLSAAAYYWAQLAAIGGCGRGGKFGNIVYGPPCPAGTHSALLVMFLGLGLGTLGAHLYAVGSSRRSAGRLPIATLWLAQLRFWPAAVLAWFAGKWYDPDPVAFRPGREVIAVALVALVAVNVIGALGFGRGGLREKGPSRAVAWTLGLLLGACGAFGTYAVQRAVGPTGPLDAASARGETVASVGSLLELRNLRLMFDGLTRELGPRGGLSVFNVLEHSATADGTTSGGTRVSLDVDAGAVVHRAVEPPSGSFGPAVALAQLRPEAVARVYQEAGRRTRSTLVGVTLSASTRTWVVAVKEPELDPFVANLDGSGVHRLRAR